MKTLIIILSFLCIVLFSTSAFAQFDIGDKIKKKVGRKVDKEVDKTIDKGIDETEKVIKGEGENEDGDRVIDAVVIVKPPKIF